MARARASAVPLLRVLGLAVVLFAVVLTHGATPGSAAGHLVTSAATSVSAAPEPPHHGVDTPSAATAADRSVGPRPAAELFAGPRDGRADHGAGHPGEHCASAQPQQGPVLAQSRFAASVSEVVVPGSVPTVGDAGEPRVSDRSSAALRASVVQQV
ncbi:hypothetical protein, partial [Streptomyces adelaidensis]|uniref:hypothetical protein n=1 Tax=Streptomyces adelaidensis TaxID=2796465 RepID=UPI001F42E161